MAVINNAVTSGSINTATDLIATSNAYGVVVVNNLHASADLYLNIGADAVSTGTIAGILIAAKTFKTVPVFGRRVSVASGTASIPVAYHEQII